MSVISHSGILRNNGGGWVDGWMDRHLGRWVFDKRERERRREEMKSLPLLYPRVGGVRHNSGTRGFRQKGLNPG